MKKALIPILSAGLMLAGCSAAYKTGQTPDDVYYSESPRVAAEVASNKPQKTRDEGYQSYFGNEDDNYLRMKVQNGGRWNNIDDFDYWYGYNSYNPYMRPFGYNSFNTWGISIGGYNPYFGVGHMAYSGFYNPYSFGGGFYHPGYFNSPVFYPVVINKRPTYSNNGYRPSLSSYQNGSYDRGAGRNQRSGQPYRSIFNSGNNGSSTYDRPARTFNNTNSNSGSYTPSSSGSSRTSSGGGSSSSGSSSGGGRGGRGGR